ncbi:hypothetical protein ACFTWD_21100, partial [Streptomyces sp. NPDC056943]|uniref:hypothetical protein n=1 Tax=Streptomyces sp. NPDC056943 TaxID=3345971 RepID=UPI0036275E51
STNLALIFGTLLSSQGADASFVLTLAGFPPGFPSVFRVSSLADPISRFCHPLERAAGAWNSLSRFPFPAGSNITRLSRSP